jgi:hypothetical protein
MSRCDFKSPITAATQLLKIASTRDVQIRLRFFLN